MKRILSERGAALPSVLIMASILGLMALSFVQTSRQSSLAAAYETKSLSLDQAAQAGIELALADFATAETKIPVTGAPFSFVNNGYRVTIRITDENGKADLNMAQPPLLMRLIEDLSAASQWPYDATAVTDAILDFRAGKPRGAFAAIDDLLKVPGVDEQLFRLLEPYITVSSLSAQINPQTAERALLRAIPGLTPSSIDVIFNARAANKPAPTPTAASVYLANRTGPFFRIQTNAVGPSGAQALRDVIVYAESGQILVIVQSRPAYAFLP
ncbi:MAG: hypothetical protein AAF850_00330 [Pseudomonadota bacterium]